MKHSCLSNLAKALLFVLINCCIAHLAGAQQSPGQGLFRFVNATSIPGKVFLAIDANKLRPEGFDSGNTTGAIGILVGTHRFAVSSPSNGAAEMPVSVQPSSSVTIIAYCKTVVDPRTRQPTEVLQLLPRQNPPHTRGRQFQLLYLSSRPSVNLTINGQNRSVSALREIGSDQLPTTQIKIEYGGKSVLTFDAPEAGNFLVVVFDDKAGKVSGVVVPDYS
jgi:hypothetical protein